MKKKTEVQTFVKDIFPLESKRENLQTLQAIKNLLSLGFIL